MTATDLDAQVRAGIAAAIEALALNPDDYGYTAQFQVMQAAGKTVLGWQLLITCRSPLLGKPPIAAIGAIITGGVPALPEIRQAVAKALAELQATTAKLLKAGNGHPAGLPGKVK